MFAADRNWSEGSSPQLLDSALAECSAGHQLGIYFYLAQDVRTAVAGHSNASRGEGRSVICGDNSVWVDWAEQDK